MNPDDFVHLHLHTDFSLLDGACAAEPLMKRLSELEMPAAAITDHGNLFGAMSFYKAAHKQGIKPIIGCEVYVARGASGERTGGDKSNHHLVLLCENATGYRNLVKLVSHGFLQGFYYKPRIDKELLSRRQEGLICLSACLSGEVCSNLAEGHYDQARRVAGEFRDIFGKDRYFIELQDQGLEVEQRINPELVRLAKSLDSPIVATNDCHYVTQQDARPHEVLLCIQTGKTMSDRNRMRFATDQFYVKSAREMADLFRDHPQALRQTLAIAERCQFQFEEAGQTFPHFEVPGEKSLDEYFEQVCWDGFEARLPYWKSLQARGELKLPPEAYEERLKHEIGIIKQMRYPSYFLIVWDFMRYARQQRIPVGPGRGSAAGSLASYCLKITDIDPLQHGLLFERFLNPERISLPDIDIDFCTNRRQEVINYVTRKYGRDNVCQIVTFGTMAAKAAVKDVGRGLDMPYAEVDRIAKLIPAEIGMKLAKAVETTPALRSLIAKDERVRELFDIALRLEGMARHASTHAAGVVISPVPLTEIVPLYKTSKDEITTQYAMDYLEEIGLLKMDFLALTTLTVLDRAVKLIRQTTGEDRDLATLALNDGKTYEMFSQGLSNGIFQFESAGMKDILRRFKPEKLEDLTALNALYRPGPLGGGMIDDFIKRKHGQKKVAYDLPELREILEETLGVILYQEQVQQIANKLAGYSLAEGDLLRRAMGKKKQEEMEAQREKFIAGARARGFDARKTARIFDLMVKFAGYGFNKAHSAAYAILAYQTGYLKANYPVCFMSALLTSEINNSDKIVKYINECRDLGIRILPPDVNVSDLHFTPSGPDIRFGLGAIKNVGTNAIVSILEARKRVSRFGSLFEFCEEIDLRVLNKRVIESLLKAGALDSLGGHRSQLLASLDRAIDSAQRIQRDRESGQRGLFAGFNGAPSGDDRSLQSARELPDTPEWPQPLVLANEKEALGFYITGHPLEKFVEQIERITSTKVEDVHELETGREVQVGAMISSLRLLRTRKGDRMATLSLEDLSGSVDAVVFPDLFKRCEPLMESEAAVLVRGILELEDSGNRKVIVREIQPIDASPAPPPVTIYVKLEAMAQDLPARLRSIMEENPGESRVTFQLEHPQSYLITLQSRHLARVKADGRFVRQVEKILRGAGSVRR